MPAEGLEPPEARRELSRSLSLSALLDASGLPRKPDVHGSTES